MSSITNVVSLPYKNGSNPSPAFSCPVVIKAELWKGMGGECASDITECIIREVAEVLDLVSRFEESIEYVDFFPVIWLGGKTQQLALRIKLDSKAATPIAVIEPTPPS